MAQSKWFFAVLWIQIHLDPFYICLPAPDRLHETDPETDPVGKNSWEIPGLGACVGAGCFWLLGAGTGAGAA